MKVQLECEVCNRVQVVASGHIAAPELWPIERLVNAGAKIGWGLTEQGWECPECAGNTEPIKLSLSDLQNI